MFKKFLKILWWICKTYTTLTLILWAFIDASEIGAELCLLEGTKLTYLQKVKIVNNKIWNNAIRKWKYWFGLIDSEEESEA